MEGARRRARGFAKAFTFARSDPSGGLTARSGRRPAAVCTATLLFAVASVSLLLPAGVAAQTSTTSTTVAAPADLTGQCLTCHSQEYLGSVEDGDGASKDLYIDPQAYEASAHALLPCNSCHTGFSHDPHKMVTNAEFFAQTAAEACRNCHDDQYEMYKQSYHGELSRGGAAGGEKAPECVDCHGDHAIQKVDSEAYRQSIQDMCGTCHGGREDTFLDTYHGKAITLGREASATCVDCHGDHSILPVSNPESTLSEANILATCRQCHPDAGEGFTSFLVHIKATSTSAPLIVFVVAMFYLALIVGVFTFGGIHTLLYIYRGLKDGLYFGKGGH